MALLCAACQVVWGLPALLQMLMPVWMLAAGNITHHQARICIATLQAHTGASHS